MFAIEVENLQKSFGQVKAVQGVSFTVQSGEIFSLLGPNGAGKTTTLAMLSCLLRPDAGEARILGHSIRTAPQEVKKCLGVVPQEIALYPDLSARENLTFWGKMYGLRGKALKNRVDEILELIGLSERANERLARYSGGMKRRVNIGAALLHRPQVIYLDEPTVGIDPQSRRNILDGVIALKQEGATVLYTTHYMEEAQELSDHLAIMDHGKLIACGTQAELVRLVGELDRILLTLAAAGAASPDFSAALQAWAALPGVQAVERPADEAPAPQVSLLAQAGRQLLPAVIQVALQHNLPLLSVDIQEPNLETVFLHLTGRALRD